MNVEAIKEFRGEYFFLSNFYRAPFEWRGDQWPTVEHAFQAAKALHDPAYIRTILFEPDPGMVKQMGRKVQIDVSHWDAHKVSYMREIVHAKFSTVQGLAGKLINTGAAMLVEGNTWHDYFWGRCEGRGKNVLGAILMEERGYWLWMDRTQKDSANFSMLREGPPG